MDFQSLPPDFQIKLLLLLPFAILDVILKGFALWKSANRGQLGWFIALLIVNSLGILPGVYLLTNVGQKSEKHL